MGTGGPVYCGATTKAGTPCGIPRAPGRSACAAHDPDLRGEAQAAGIIANRRRPGYLSHDEAEAAVVFATRADIKATLERLSRHVVAGELEARAVNATILAANGALAVLNEEDKATTRRAQAMSDEELKEAVESDYREWLARQDATG